MWGTDDNGTDDPGAVVILWRSGTVSSAILPSTWRAFGFAENEARPLPPKTAHRMFAMGGCNYLSNHQTTIGWATTRLDNGTDATGNSITGHSLNNQPALGNIATWCFLYGQTSPNTSPRVTGNFPITSSFTQEFELLPCELMMETWDYRNALGTEKEGSVFPLNGRSLGTFPIARYGVDVNSPDLEDWEITDDTRWLRTQDGVYLPWSGSLP
jgi:hypothetical protein